MFVTSQELQEIKNPNNNIFICFKCWFNPNRQIGWGASWRKLSELDLKSLNNYLKNRRHYYTIDLDKLKNRIEIGMNVDLIINEFDVPIEVLNHFSRNFLGNTIDKLLISSYSKFRADLMNNMLSLSKRFPNVAIKLFDYYIANQDKNNKNEEENRSIPEQLLNLLEKK